MNAIIFEVGCTLQDSLKDTSRLAFQISWIFKLMSFASVHYKKYTRRLIENFIWKIQQRLRVIIRFIRKCPVATVTNLLRCTMLLSFQSIKFWSWRLCLSNVNNLCATQIKLFRKRYSQIIMTNKDRILPRGFYGNATKSEVTPSSSSSWISCYANAYDSEFTQFLVISAQKQIKVTVTPLRLM